MNLLAVTDTHANLVDIDRILVTARHYTDGEFAFGLLEFGTCFLPRPGERFNDEARRLVGFYGSSSGVNFDVREMDDGNYVVRFSEHVFGIVFNDEFRQCRASIVEELATNKAPERLVGMAGRPDDHVLIGIHARSRLFADARETRVVRQSQAERRQ